jgi:tetratricopeptide (TPR) repeat protein
MSLLMDALKKAELAKRQGQGEGSASSPEAPAQGGFTLEPLHDAETRGSAAAEPATESGSGSGNLPHLPSHLEELDAQFLAEAKQAASVRLKAPPAPPREPVAEQPAAVADIPAITVTPIKPRTTATKQNGQQSQSTAQNLFAAKQADKPPSRKNFAIAIGVLTVLSVCGIGGYFWWQLQPKTSLVASRTPMPPPSAAAARPAAVPPAPTFATPPAAGTPGTAPTGARPATQPADDEDDEVVPAAAKAAAQPRRVAPPVPAEADGPIRVTRAPLKVNPALISGFDAFNRGDLALAQSEYERAQKADPRNTDALHGLAAIAVRQGRLDQAELLYRRITEADPHDTVAMSALINMRGQIDPGTAESRLKTLSADQPELAAPQFALGNLYARHGRWNEAQQAYFRAYNAEPDNPDIIYNLAISLEHLRQNKLAAQYYSQAIAAAQIRTAGFDKGQAAARLRSLQP